MKRRHFLMGSLAAGAALRPRVASANDTVRIACVGVHAQGREHLRRYGAMQNVEIAAICDIDESVLKPLGRNREGRQEAAGGYTDLRKLLEDKSIDAVSIATPNHHHTLQTIWACQAGKDVYVEKPCSHNMFEARADRGGGAEVQPHGAARHQQPFQHRPRGGASTAGRADRRRLHGARPVLQVARHHRPQAGGTGARRRALRPVARSRARARSSRRIGSTTTGTGSGITATATSATRASTRWTMRAGAWA